MNFSRSLLILLLSLLIYNISYSQKKKQKIKPKTIEYEQTWADSVLKTLTLDEKIAQLITIKVFTNKNDKYYQKIGELIKENKVGGICFFKGDPFIQALLTNKWQQLVRIPMLVSIDGEWGVSMRLDSIMPFPRLMALGAIQNDTLIYKMGVSIAKQCKRLGIHMNFGPVIDLNINPLNPVINTRSFGENKYKVAAKASAYLKGMQDNKVMGSAKHFPGHGDTDSDSHYTLPIINHSKTTIDTLDLFPFKQLIKEGVASIMVAHLYIPSLDKKKNTPSTLSKGIITDLLQKELGFNGLIITDALDMKGVSKFYNPGDLEVKALEAGNDILLLPQDIPLAIKSIKAAIDSNIITEKEINAKCLKVLKWKKWAGADYYKTIDLNNITKDLNNYEDSLLVKQITESSITLIKNTNNILPIKRFDTLRIATVSIGDSLFNTFQSTLDNYAYINHYNVSKNPSKGKIDTLFDNLKNYNLILISLHNTSVLPNKNYGMTPEMYNLIDTISQVYNVVLALNANPYILNNIKNNPKILSILVSYQANEFTYKASAEAIMGAIPINGILPVSINKDFKEGMGISISKANRLQYINKFETPFWNNKFANIDSIVKKGLDAKAYPGCQVLIAKSGKVLYYKSFGTHTYEDSTKVTNTDIYDIASITKVAATTIAVMKLEDDKKIDIDNTIDSYLHFKTKTNKKDLKLIDLLSHQSGLKSWIPFYTSTLIKGELDPTVYSSKYSEEYPIKVAKDIFIRKYYPDVIMEKINESNLNKKKEYVYSDLGFIYLYKIIEKQTNQKLNDFVETNYYKPLGLQTMTYLPLNKFEINRILPSEFDSTYRKQIIHGYVNDQAAAMFGGISGHAGLFSNANDLAILFQMILNKGTYGYIQYLKPETIKKYTSTHFADKGNRRGLGFDKPLLSNKETGTPSKFVSDESFGHTGFTGTFVWADPKDEIIVIFLSNRTYPYAHSPKLVRMGIRTEIQDEVYRVLKEKK